MKATMNKGKRLGQYVPDYVVFDLETTGIKTQMDSIIEISAVKVIKNKVTDEYSTLVNPHRHIPKGATTVNGITDDMVADAPELKEAMDGFLDFIQDDILVGHNIHTFDMNFILHASFKLYEKPILNDYVDTLYLARKCLPQLPHHTLSDVAAFFHIDTEGAHRALNDCHINQKCYEELGKLLAKDPDIIDSDVVCPKCGGDLLKRKGRYGFFYGCSGYPECRYTRDAN